MQIAISENFINSMRRDSQSLFNKLLKIDFNYHIKL